MGLQSKKREDVLMPYRVALWCISWPFWTLSEFSGHPSYRILHHFLKVGFCRLQLKNQTV